MAPRAAIRAGQSADRAAEPLADVSERRAPARRASSSPAKERRRAPPVDAKADPFLASIVRSKVQPSPVRVQTLARARLLDWLRDHRDDRLKLIMAEAGYGKTTLLADFARREVVRCLWYKLETSDGDWVTFINYLVASVREVVPGFGERTAGVLRQMTAMNTPRDVVLGSFLSELGEAISEPMMLILDDFQLVDESEDVRSMVEQVLERAPDGFTILIASRRRPGLRLGRLTAQGVVAELSTDDLRFSREETEELFGSTYGHPLEADVLSQVDARTEGWPASLQLLYSSIRERRPSEVRTFIREMSGAEGSLYDFLAEEVLGHLSPDLAKFVTMASILERIVPAYVAALYQQDELPNHSQVQGLLEQAEDLGLLGRSSTTSVSRRFHPLLHEFLQRHLGDFTTTEQRASMHLRIAKAAAGADWLAACHHFIEAGEPERAMALLNDSAADALGTGAWGPAAELIPRMGEMDSPAAVGVLQARQLLDRDVSGALGLLASLSSRPLTNAERALVRSTRAAALYRAGMGDEMLQCLVELVQDPGTPATIREIAIAHQTLMLGGINRSACTATGRHLVALGDRQAGAGRYWHAAISYHNAMGCAVEAADYQHAREIGAAALQYFAKTGVPRPEPRTTEAHMSTSAAELGMFSLAEREAERACDLSSDAFADAFAQAAEMYCAIGDLSRAESLLAEAKRRLRMGLADLGSTATVFLAEAQVLVALGKAEEARSRLAVMPPHAEFETGFAVATETWLAIAAAVAGHSDAVSIARNAMKMAQETEAWRSDARLAVVAATLEGTDSELQTAIGRAARLSQLAIPDVAPLLAQYLHRFEQVPSEIEASMTLHPARWLPALRATLSSGNVAAARAAARVLSRCGDSSDVPRLVAFERMYTRGKRSERLGRSLARRVSPQLFVHDLGRVRYEIGDKRIEVTRTRRKAASLLVLLLTRPNITATKDQAMEALWPDLTPTAAANSLNQTLYFLRRDIDEFYDEHTSADYIVYESELLWLDPDLVHADSSIFLESASHATTSEGDLENRLQALDLYVGKFAPEFEYEEWSMARREHLHAAYLLLARSVELELVDHGELGKAAAVARRVLEVDPHVSEFERDLVWLYGRLGARDAAHGQYLHFAQALRSDFGLDPPSFADVLADPPRGPMTQPTTPFDV